MNKAYVILNPVAGNSDPESLRAALEQHFAQAGKAFDLHLTQAEEPIAAVVRQALEKGHDLIIAAGGDGTVSGAADGLANTGVPLGIIPVGTGNALARDLGIPLDPEAAIRLILGEHELKDIDVLNVANRHFVLNVSLGVSAQAMHATKSEAKQRFGRLAYVWIGVGKLLGMGAHRFSLTIDGRSARLRATEIAVMNSRGVGAPFLKWGADTRLDDGRIEVFIFRPRTLLDPFRILWNVVRGRPRRDPNVRVLPAREAVAIETARLLPVQADGDVIGQTPVEVRVVPAALRVIAPGEGDPP